MNYLFKELPRSTDTLDFQNVNSPFIVAQQNQFFIDINVKKLIDFIKPMRIYTEKDKITLRSNGISGFFKVDLSAYSVNILSEVVIVASRFVRDNMLTSDITPTTPINLAEISTYLGNNGVLMKEHAYKQLQKKTDFVFSNMVSYETLKNSCISRENTTVELMLPKVSNTIDAPTYAVARKTAESVLIHRTKESNQITIKDDAVVKYEISSAVLNGAEFVDGYTATNDDDAISKQYAIDNGYSLTGKMVAPIYIHNPTAPNTPITKSKNNDLSNDYISTIEKSANDIEISRKIPTIEDNNALTSIEVENYVNEFFTSLTNPSIDNMDEFETYLKSVCDVVDEYLGYDLVIPGGKVYLGFDYNNMYSIFNSEAFEKILFTELGAFDSTKGKVFDASRYFKNQAAIDKLAAYAQHLNLDFDISKDTIGQVFRRIRQIVSKLCRMTPDIVPPKEEVKIPVFQAVMVIVPPIFDSFYPNGAGMTYVHEPRYEKPYKFFTLSAPIFTTVDKNKAASVFMSIPIYVTTYKSMIIKAPPLNMNYPQMGVTHVINAPSLSSPTELTYYSRKDGKIETMLLFQAVNTCKERYRLSSYRTINMIDVGVVFSYILPLMGDFFWLSKKKSIVMSAPQMAAKFLGDVFCRIVEKTDFHANITIEDMFAKTEGTTPPGSGGQNSSGNNCSGFSTGVRYNQVGESLKKIGEISIQNNGLTLDGNGHKDGTANATATEWFKAPTDNGLLTLAKWMEYGSDEYQEKVAYVVSKISDDINSYLLNKRRKNITSIVSLKVTLSGFEAIKNGDHYGDVMVEYLDLKESKKSELRFLLIADEMGISSSQVTVDGLSIVDAVSPYANVAIGTDTLSFEDWKAYIDDPPLPKPGPNKVYVWRPSFSSYNTSLQKHKFMSLSSQTNAVFSVYGPIVLLSEDSQGQVRYEAIGTDVSAGTTEINNSTYYTVESSGNSVIIGKVGNNTSAPIAHNFADAPCDPWLSQNKIIGSSNYALSSFVPVGLGYDENMGDYLVENKILDFSGCDGICQGTSGIAPDNINNISTLESLDPDTQKQPEGKTPGAVQMKIRASLSKSYQKYDSEGNVHNYMAKGKTDLCMTFGVIDGLALPDGDILALGYKTQEEIDQAKNDAGDNAKAKTYIGPTKTFQKYTDLERREIDGTQCSIYTVRLADIIKEKIKDPDTGKLFIKYKELANNGYTDDKDAKIIILPEETAIEEATPTGTVVVGEFTTSGLVFSYKHSAGDPTFPVLLNYTGSTELDLVGGSKLVSTISAPIPEAIVTNQDDAESFLSTLKIKNAYIHFYINNKTFQVVIADTKAAVSQDRDVQVVWKKEEETT